MTADRVEHNDLARRHPDVVRKLASDWEAWAQPANVDRWPGPRLTNWGDPTPAK